MTTAPPAKLKTQFLLLATDHTDAGAVARRLAARPAHLARAAEAKRDGLVLVGGATLADADTGNVDNSAPSRMTGSMLVYSFTSRAEAEEYIKLDPYVTGNVWASYSLTPFRLAPLLPLTSQN